MHAAALIFKSMMDRYSLKGNIFMVMTTLQGHLVQTPSRSTLSYGHWTR